MLYRLSSPLPVVASIKNQCFTVLTHGFSNATRILTMQFSIEKASELVNKSVKTLYRHMAQNGLRYSIDENNNRKISLEELQSFYKIEVDQTIPDSQMRF